MSSRKPITAPRGRGAHGRARSFGRLARVPVLPVVAVVGATGAGKTGLSLDLAERLGGEIVNTDAMAVYRGMDIGTAKLPAAERRGIPHHLLDLLDVTEPLTVAEFQRQRPADDRRPSRPRPDAGAGRAARRSTPGRSWTASSSPGTDPAVRRRLEQELAERRRPAALHERLRPARPRGRSPDPARERPPDRPRPGGRRDHRSAVHRQPARPLEYADPRHRPGRRRHRPAHPGRAHRAAGRRAMFDRRTRRRGRAAARARARPGTHRPRGDRLPPGGWRTSAASSPSTEAREQTVTATRRFARRQDSWFRKDPRIVWVRLGRPRAGRAGAASRGRVCALEGGR